jgi:hypothetical protein
VIVFFSEHLQLRLFQGSYNKVRETSQNKKCEILIVWLLSIFIAKLAQFCLTRRLRYSSCCCCVEYFLKMIMCALPLHQPIHIAILLLHSKI